MHYEEAKLVYSQQAIAKKNVKLSIYSQLSTDKRKIGYLLLCIVIMYFCFQLMLFTYVNLMKKKDLELEDFTINCL